MDPIERPDFALRPVVETWDSTVFEVSGRGHGGRTAYLVVPAGARVGFDETLARGELDALVVDYLSVPDRGRTLTRHRQTQRLGLFDRMGDPLDLAPPERDPRTGRVAAPSGRDHKGQDDPPSSSGSAPARAQEAAARGTAAPTARPRIPRRVLVPGAVVVGLLLVTGIGYAATRPSPPPSAAEVSAPDTERSPTGAAGEPAPPTPSSADDGPDAEPPPPADGLLPALLDYAVSATVTRYVNGFQEVPVGTVVPLLWTFDCDASGTCLVYSAIPDDDVAQPSLYPLFAGEAMLAPDGRLSYDITVPNGWCADGSTIHQVVDLLLSKESLVGTVTSDASAASCPSTLSDGDQPTSSETITVSAVPHG